MGSTFEKLSAILHKDYAVAPELLTLDSTLTDLGIDSLGVVELLFTVEDVFALRLPSDPVSMHTIADVVRYIDGLLLNQSQPANPGLSLVQG